MDYRIEKDTLGEINVPVNKLWGAHTRRSLQNFNIGPHASMPIEIIESYVKNSLMLVTALTPHMRYENAGKIAHQAFKKNYSLKQAATELNLVSEKQFDEWVKPNQMTRPNIAAEKS